MIDWQIFLIFCQLQFYFYDFDYYLKHLLYNLNDFYFRYQQFERDCDETKSWINEKLKVASDDSYLDPTNLNGKVQKHQNFEQV